MSSDVFFDTNIIVYFASESDPKAHISAQLLKAGGVVSVQVLNEFTRVGLRKRRLTFVEIHKTIDAVRAVCKVVALTLETHERGLAYAERYKLGVFDAMIVAAAVLAGCTTLYTEDMHDGLVIDGVTMRNPFSGLDAA